MKRFRFNLQAVLVLRQRQEQLARELYARTETARRQAAAELAFAERQRDGAWAISREQLQKGATADLLWQLGRYCDGLEQRRAACAVALHEAYKATDLAWKKLVLARRRREAVVKYRERRWAGYLRQCRREEQILLDEIAQHRTTALAELGLNAVACAR